MILNPPTLREASRILLCCLLAISLMGCAARETATVVPATREPGPIRPGEVEAFADDFFCEQMDELSIPGLTFVFVRDGRVQVSKGYGSANLAQGSTFFPYETVVRLGRISMLSAAAAVM